MALPVSPTLLPVHMACCPRHVQTAETMLWMLWLS